MRYHTLVVLLLVTIVLELGIIALRMSERGAAASTSPVVIVREVQSPVRVECIAGCR